MRYEGIQSNFAFRAATKDTIKKEAQLLIDVSGGDEIFVMEDFSNGACVEDYP